MKNIRLFLLCLVCSLVLSEGYAQNRNISLRVKNAPLSEVFATIEQQSGYTFFYSDKIVNTSRRVTIDAQGEDVLVTLGKIFENDNIKCSIIDGNIVLEKGAEPKQQASVAAAKSNHFVGYVVDKNGEPVIGATIISLSNMANATIVDVNGRFELAVAKGEKLELSCVGYASQIITAGKSGAKYTLKEDFQMLEEVIVVGYGTQRRSDVTGAIASVSTEKLNATPTTSLGEMLRGAAAGVHVTLGSAEPGGTSSVLIRGRRSLSGDNAPLYIVDGVPMSSIDDINSNDIESMEILKDASSQSIYGARAANGVILITTKRGQVGKLKVSYSGYAAVQDINRNFEFYNGEEWAYYRAEAYYNAYGSFDTKSCLTGLMLDVFESGEWVDWEKLMISKAFQQKHDVLVQSGNDKTKYAFGIGAYTQDGMVLNSGFEKVSGRLNIDHKITKNISMGANLSFSRAWKQSTDGSFNSFVTMPPLAKVYEDDGVTLRKDVTLAGESHFNPLWNINNAESRSQTDRLLINLFADWKIAPGLSYRLNTSLSERNVDSGSYLGINHTTGATTQGKATLSQSDYFDYLVENILNYSTKIGDDHKIDATLMQSVNYITWKSLGITGTGFSNDDLSYHAIGSAIEHGVPTYQLSERKMLSLLGRVRYNYKDRYLFTAAVRMDGSSVFGPGNKYGVFPSASFAWRVNEEEFMKNMEWISNLKFRLSYGQVGNQGISPYTTLGLADKYMYEFGTYPMVGYLPDTTLPNPNLKWETSTSTNIGIDFGFIGGRIGGSVELYNTDTTDLLVAKSLSQSTGYSSQLVNMGRVNNRGVEVTLNLVPVKTKEFEWNVDLTYAKNKNEIVRIDGSLDENGQPKNDVNNNWFIGEPMNVYYDYAFDGIWQLDDDIASSHMPDAKPGAIRVKDASGDGKLDDKDRVIMYRDPEWIGTLSTGIFYKGFDVRAELYVSAGGTRYNSYLTSFNQGGDMTGKRNGVRRNYWTANNPSNEAPAPNMTQAPAYITALGYQDASFVRLRNVQIGYNFPKKVTKALSMQSLRMYATLTNIWTMTDVIGYGPEQNPGSYPEPRTVLFGVNVSF
ncbi:MAG: TonB-dependent receptor [Tidjanibacter sp.]|nr:TonB-dependent receptor [Tidjanibacter sp.]